MAIQFRKGKGRLAGKIAIVTGAGTGIGEAIAVVYAEEGAKVVVSDINDANGATVVNIIKQGGGEAMYIACDVSDPKQVESLIDQTVKAYGRLDTICNNAGYLSVGNCDETPLEEWDKGIAVDLSGVFYGCKYAIKAMLKTGGGSIVNISSVSGLFGDYAFCWYNAAKGGVANMTRNIAIDYARRGIRCNAVNPGLTLSEICKALFEADPRTKDGVGRNYPMGRPGAPREVATACMFLASDEASIINGVNLLADGGITAHTGQPAYVGMDEYLARQFVEVPPDRF